MPESLPEKIDPFRFAEKSRHLNGHLFIKNMPRLCDSLLSQEGTVLVDLIFGKDEENRVYIKGQVQASLKLQCQRCMEPFDYEIIADFLLGVVNTLEEATALTLYEPTITKEGCLVIQELIEDELILNLPIIPKHQLNECKMTLPTNAEEDKKMENPFQVLRSLKDKQ